MKLLILPEKEAIKLSHTLDEKTSIISITCPNEEDVKFASNKNIDSIFRMKFNDIERRYELPGCVLEAPCKEDLSGLKGFVDNLDCDLLIVHCAAGYSRSAAVGAAINEYLNLGCKIFGNPAFYPNALVYKLCLEELGFAKDQKYFEEIFANHNQIVNNEIII